METNDLIKEVEKMLEYYKNNPGSDPDVENYITLSSEVGICFRSKCPNYQHKNPNAPENYPNEYLLLTQYQELKNITRKKIIENDLGVDYDHPLKRIIDDAAYGAEMATHFMDNELRAMLGGETLKILQGKRAVRRGEIESYKYDDITKLNKIHELASETRSYVLHDGEKKIDSRKELIEEIEKAFEFEFTIDNMEASLPKVY